MQVTIHPTTTGAQLHAGVPDWSQADEVREELVKAGAVIIVSSPMGDGTGLVSATFHGQAPADLTDTVFIIAQILGVPAVIQTAVVSQ